jgi:hypothetical protein
LADYQPTEREFANEIAAIEEPVILTNTAATKWKAMTAWNPSYLASRMPELKRVQTHKNRTFVYFHAERPLSELPGMYQSSANALADND